MDDLALGWRTALLLVISLQLLVVAGLLWMRRFDFLANGLLASLMIVIALTLIPQIIGFAGFYDAFPWLSFAPLQNELLVGPLIFAYAYSLATGRFPKFMWLMVLPGTFDFIYQIYWFVQPIDTRWARVGDFHSNIYSPARTGFTFMLTIAGLAGAGRVYLWHRKFMRNYSSAAAEFDPRWLPVFLFICGFILITFTTVEVVNLFFERLDYFDTYAFHVLLALSCWAMGQAALVMQSERFPRISTVGIAGEDLPKGRDWIRDAQKLRQQILDENWHLEPRLSAPELARRVGTNDSYLSRTVNQGAGVNFNRFVNEIRIEAVKSRLADGSEDVLRAALDCGFNSKATFNRVFKDIVGETPAAYRTRNWDD